MQEPTTTIKRRKYDASFKKEVLKMVADGRPVNEVSQTLGIGENLIYKWRRRLANPVLPTPALAADATDLAARNRELTTLLQKAEEERDILKKALLIFGRPT
jgi:transposase